MSGVLGILMGIVPKRRPGLALLAAMMMGGVLGGPAQAASLQVSPIRVEFEPTEQAQALNLSNNGTEPLEAQVRVQRWSQADGREVLSPADDIVASPAIVRIAPGQRQVVRLVRAHPVAGGKELSYRVLVDELPKQQSQQEGGLKVLLRYSIPVFVAATRQLADQATGKASPAETDLTRVSAKLERGDNGKSQLHVRNDGISHVRISFLSLSGSNGSRQSLGNGLIGYVLAGQEMSWPVDVAYPLAQGQTLKARFNDDREARAVPLDNAGR